MKGAFHLCPAHYDVGVRANLASLVDEYRQHAGETAVVEHRGNRSYRTSYGGLAELAGRFAAELERRGVAPGDRVVLWGRNSAEWIGIFFGCLLRGVLAVPLDAAGSGEFAERVIQDVAPKLVVGDERLLRVLTTDVPKLQLARVASHLPRNPIFLVSETVDADASFQIVFTSGTTSEPKGIVHTHRNVLASLQPIENEIERYRRYERWVHPLRFLEMLPLSHVFGQFMGLWVPPLLGAEVHFVEQFETGRVVELIRRERISVLVAVPRVLQLLRAHLVGRFGSLEEEMVQAKGLPFWKRWWKFRQVHRTLGWKFWAVISGGATLPVELEGFWNELGFALIQGYGMTETAALVTLNHPFRIGRGTIGRALPGREVRISDEGEILVRGDMLAGATWQGGRMHPREGEWLATGDLAVENKSGELRFLGRKGDVIVTGAGMNVHPADLEEVLNRQPSVRASVVVPCEMMGGTEPVAVVIFSGDDEGLQVVVRQANQQLAEYQQIRRVLRWPELQFPYTPTGKLLRRQVEKWACESIAGQRQEQAPGSQGDVLADLAGEVTGERIANATDRSRLSEDLHLDSLGRVQLLSALEQRLGVELDDDAVAGAETLGDLRALITQNTGAYPSSKIVTQAAGLTETHHEEEQAAKVQGSVAGTKVVPEKTAEEPRYVYPRWPWGLPVRAIRIVFLEIAMRPLIWALAAPRVIRHTRGLPHGPVLVIANHVTAYDGALVLYGLPGRLRRRMAIAMSGEMLLDFRRGRNQGNVFYSLLAPVAYWLLTALFNVFPLPRMRGFRKSFEHAGDAMDQGYSVMVFPEGTRSPDGKLHSFRPGIGLLALESRVPALPVVLIGLGEMNKTGWFRSGRLEIRVGEAISFGEDEKPEELTSRLEEIVRQLGAQSRCR